MNSTQKEPIRDLKESSRCETRVLTTRLLCKRNTESDICLQAEFKNKKEIPSSDETLPTLQTFLLKLLVARKPNN